MRAEEGQKWSYVEMILSSEVEVKLRCDLGWKREMRREEGCFLQGRWEGKGRPKTLPKGPKKPLRPSPEAPRGIQDRPRPLQVAPRTSPELPRPRSNTTAGTTCYMNAI